VASGIHSGLMACSPTSPDDAQYQTVSRPCRRYSPAGTVNCKFSKLRVQARRDDRYRPPVPIVGRIGDELIIEGELPRIDGQRVVGLQNFFRTGIGKCPVAYQGGISASGQVSLMAFDMVLITPAIAKVSSGRPQNFPDTEVPAARVASSSVNA